MKLLVGKNLSQKTNYLFEHKTKFILENVVVFVFFWNESLPPLTACNVVEVCLFTLLKEKKMPQSWKSKKKICNEKIWTIISAPRHIWNHVGTRRRGQGTGWGLGWKRGEQGKGPGSHRMIVHFGLRSLFGSSLALFSHGYSPRQRCNPVPTLRCQ